MSVDPLYRNDQASDKLNAVVSLHLPPGEIKQISWGNTIMAHVTMKRGRSLIAIAAAVADEHGADAAAED